MAAILAFALVGNAKAQTVYVSESGDDNGLGTIDDPFRTLSRAFLSNPRVVLVEIGEYIFESPIAIPSNTTVRGGFTPAVDLDGNPAWFKSTERTRFLLVGQVGQASIVLRASDSPQVPGGAVEDVVLVGGFVSVLMEEGTRLFEVEIIGGSEAGTPGNQLAGILVSRGVEGRPSVIDRTRIRGGNTGIRIEQNGTATIMESLVRDATGRGLFVSGTGTVHVEHSIFQGSRSDGIAVIGNSNVSILNSTVRRSLGDGIRIRQADVHIEGCLIEANERGLAIIESAQTLVRHCTVVLNRKSGLYMRQALPDMYYNIFAYNERFGVEEDDATEDTGGGGSQPPTPTPTPAPILLGGDLEGNLFWENEIGSYLDSGEIVLIGADEVNNQTVNAGTVSGNVHDDPLFVSLERRNYRLGADSPAIDQVPITGPLEKDVDGNPRTREISGSGSEGGSTPRDIGAYEFQDRLITDFGTLYYDTRMVDNPLDPNGDKLTVLDSPEWEFNPFTAPGFNPISSEFLPGRLRIYTKETYAFGAVAHLGGGFEQPEDKVAVVRARIESPDTVGIRSPRLRVSAHEKNDVVAGYLIEGSKQLLPLLEGREYVWAYDLRQGGYRTGTPDPEAFYPASFFLDLLDFIELPYQAKMDLVHFEVEYQERALFDAQFTNLLHRWTFESGVEGWTPGGIPVFVQPSMQWDAARGGLRQTAFPTNFAAEQYMFGSWFSPDIVMAPGTWFRIEARVSSPTADPEQIPGFRVRFSPNDFSFSQDVLAVNELLGEAAPGEEPARYVVYGKIPDEISQDVTYSIFWDLMGFVRPLNGTIVLEELTLRTR